MVVGPLQVSPLITSLSPSLQLLRIAVVGARFMGYMDAFKDFLIAGLQNKAEYQVYTSLLLFFFRWDIRVICSN